MKHQEFLDPFSLSIATNWDDILIRKLKGLPISDFYGSLPRTPIGSGRPSFILPERTIQKAEKHIQLVRSMGFGFTYLLNSACTANIEYTVKGRRAIKDHLKWAIEAGANKVTVASPFLIEWIHKNFPELCIKVSVIATADSISKIEWFIRLGAEIVSISPDCNRNFRFLTKVGSLWPGKIELLANNLCLQNCPFARYHYLMVGHASQTDDTSSMQSIIDYCLVRCTLEKIANPEQILKGPFIRPEDLKYYIRLGLNKFKLTDRCKNTSWILRAANAYSNESYSGNLIDILNNPQPAIEKEAVRCLDIMEMPQISDYREYYNLEKSEPIPIFIDNNKLNGYLKPFLTGHCEEDQCARCNHCMEFTGKTVFIDAEMKRVAISYLSKVLDEILF